MGFAVVLSLNLICVECSNVSLPLRSFAEGMCLVLSISDLLLKRSLRSEVGLDIIEEMK